MVGNRPRSAACMPRGPRVRIEPGTYADYLALAPLHYRAGAPATRVLVLRAIVGSDLAGVLVISMPTLNGSWRAAAWPDMPRGCKRARACWLNANVRTISRVIVDPRYRGMSIARRLVSAYLRAPLTPRTEAVAAMGACSPFFAAAGMCEVRGERSARDRRLLDCLQASGVAAWRLAEAASARRLLRRSAPLRRAIRAWACAHRGLRSRVPRGDAVNERLIELAMLAAQAALAPPRAFVVR